MNNAVNIRQKLTENQPHLLPTGWTFQASAQRLDEIGGRFVQLKFAHADQQRAVDLPQQARQIASRVTGLLEPLRLIEVDSNAAIAQLRSTKPTIAGGVREYDELVLKPAEITFQRYRVQSGQERVPVPFTLTYESLEKMVDDLTAQG